MANFLQLLGALIQPPGLNILLFILFFYYWFRSSEVVSLLFLVINIVFLYLLSIPIVSNRLIYNLESKYNTANIIELINNNNPKAIVALVDPNNLDYTYNSVINQYVAKVLRHNKLPVLFSSYLNSNFIGESDQAVKYLSRDLATDLDITAQIWTSSEGKTLNQSVELIKQILTKNSIEQVFLITNAWHMPQAEHYFKNKGINFVSVPILTNLDEDLLNNYSLSNFVPNMKSLVRSKIFFNEWIDAIFSKLF